MPELPKKKVGIVACSGEELPGGTVTRLAALRVLEQLRPGDTVTICLPLFLAGGEGDRAFARFYPTVAIDGCDKRCAARGTEKYSGKPAASVVVSELVADGALDLAGGARRLDAAGLRAVEMTAARVAGLVDTLLDRQWNRQTGDFANETVAPVEAAVASGATCSCGSGVPIQTIDVAGREVTLAGLPLIFEQMHVDGRRPEVSLIEDLVKTVKVYNAISPGQEADIADALLREYTAFCVERAGHR